METFVGEARRATWAALPPHFNLPSWDILLQEPENDLPDADEGNDVDEEGDDHDSLSRPKWKRGERQQTCLGRGSDWAAETNDHPMRKRAPDV
ncbi:hypothetical protein GLOTRDRAFT_131143 [Gloeophyllum trabeum ATCC 11539]|uniref:Uncharacterized protein n=1 Tax=Gloeophyllum trabeum (strain ATCC 11539 / FP-39264 / Madison 617) TaxID=670483 RepID=S7Q2N0_GLOTA|nr:uncharacterized protein GLOTRDRAFT_131143 [Gloeophyllum trabeum ATCC 11539]EPQ53812.1 hypothetical protein GLOTRDRAFT_131143 [Gloeophyllum trabeum ATCC 11539]